MTRARWCGPTVARAPTTTWTDGRWRASTRPSSTSGIAPDTPLHGVLHDYFAWTTTATMGRYPDSADDVPDGLSIPHWDWDGSVERA